jgi:hypothetical protein
MAGMTKWQTAKMAGKRARRSGAGPPLSKYHAKKSAKIIGTAFATKKISLVFLLR